MLGKEKKEVAQEDLVTRTHLVGYLFRAYFTNCEAGEGGDWAYKRIHLLLWRHIQQSVDILFYRLSSIPVTDEPSR